MALHHFLFLLLLYISLPGRFYAVTDRQELYFIQMKESLSGSALDDWGNSSFCNYTGITCNVQGYVTRIDISGWSLSGYFPPNVCSYLPQLQVLNISDNNIQGSFPDSIINCSSLRALNMSSLSLTGKLPNFSSMQSLRLLDLSSNKFSGDFPTSITNLTDLVLINFNENKLFNSWELPENISRLTNLEVMVLSNCNIHGSIPASIGKMTSLFDLELSQNFLQGPIPPEVGRLKNLELLMLYYNHLNGEIPNELGNLTALTDLDISMNNLTGAIPESLTRLPKLRVLQLYNNSLTGQIPEALGESRTLEFFSLYANNLTGEVPRNLGKFSPLILLDLSENQLSGPLPPDLCSGGKLVYLLLLQNMFSGEIPWNKYAKCTSLHRFRVSNNRLEGSVPDNLSFLSHASIIDLGFNQLTGPIPKKIANAKNLSELLIPNNRISGVLPPEIAGVVNLVKIDLSNNMLSGPIPSQIGSLKKLNLLLLQGNKFNSTIPESLSLLKSLNLLDLSHNQLTGTIPPSLSTLLPNSINFSYNLLSGPIPPPFITGGQEESFLGNPHLCVTAHVNSSDTPYPLCPQTVVPQKKLNRIWVVTISLAVVLFVTILFLRLCITKNKAIIRRDMTSSSSFSSFDVKSFHQISLDERDILEGLIDKNILGHGGSGTVYRIELSSGEIVAAKKLWSHKEKDFPAEEELFPDKELGTEVETLGSVRHKNIVKLYSYFSSWDCHLLVYEYMPNGNLWDALHKGKQLLDWPTRHQIALGIAQGVAYLHHDLLPPIIHRDIKTSNILLDVNYQPKVADFGVAKVLQARAGKESSHTVIAGTYGYLDPDYASSSKATTKCDVYSYGVVLMELVTGKKPVEPEFGENKNIINWITSKVETKEGAIDVLDKQLSCSFKEEMLQVLRIAIHCTARAPAPRPTMKEVVQLLIEAKPCRFDSFGSLKKNEDATTAQKYIRN